MTKCRIVREPTIRRDYLTRGVSEDMRPAIDISHTLNGRVKDYAGRNGLSLDEAYKQVIETGLETLESESGA